MSSSSTIARDGFKISIQ